MTDGPKPPKRLPLLIVGGGVALAATLLLVGYLVTGMDPVAPSLVAIGAPLMFIAARGILGDIGRKKRR